jgi:hypothetical protein
MLVYEECWGLQQNLGFFSSSGFPFGVNKGKQGSKGKQMLCRDWLNFFGC